MHEGCRMRCLIHRIERLARRAELAIRLLALSLGGGGRACLRASSDGERGGPILVPGSLLSARRWP